MIIEEIELPIKGSKEEIEKKLLENGFMVFYKVLTITSYYLPANESTEIHDTLKERQEHDKIKEKEAKEHGLKYLIIPYTDFKNIEIILEDWFNDYPVKE